MEQFLKTISTVADIMTILGLGGLLTYGAILRDKNLFGRRLFNFMVGILKFSLISFIWIFGYRLADIPYSMIILVIKGNLNYLYWEQGKEFQHLLGYIVTGAFVGSILLLISLYISTFSLYYPKLFLSTISGGRFSVDLKKYPRFANLEVLQASYGANTSFLDVTHVLRSMIDNGRLFVQASNSLAGDPIYGVRKSLIVKYRLDGIEKQSTVMEDDILEIPTNENILSVA